MIGKWHVGMYQKEFLPQYRGFDHFLGLYGGTADYWSHIQCSGSPKYREQRRNSNHPKPKNPGKHNGKMCGFDLHEAYNNTEGVPRFDLNGTHSNNIFTEELDKQLQQRNPNEPLFTYLSLQAVHGPIQTMDRFKHIYKDIYKLNDESTRTKMLAHISSLGKFQNF